MIEKKNLEVIKMSYRYKIRKVVDRNDKLIDVLEISFSSDYPKKGGDIITLKETPIPWLSTHKGLFENYTVFTVLTVLDDNELIIKA